VREQYAGVVPAEGSVVDLLVRAKDKQTGQPLKAHQIVAQVRTARLLQAPACGVVSVPVFLWLHCMQFRCYLSPAMLCSTPAHPTACKRSTTALTWRC
jgi:hypothetical protein